MGKETSEHIKFPSDGRVGGPRVTFTSFKWQGNQPKLSNEPTIKKGGTTSTITLYLPQGFSENYSANWVDEQLVTALTDLSSVGLKASTGEAVQAISDKAGLQGLMNSGKFMAGVTAFPGEFLVFKKAEAVHMTFNYDLIARNAKEAEEIQKMIATFKYRLLPTFKGWYLEFPDIWDINFLHINGPGFPPTVGAYNNMALIACNVAYGGGAQSALTFSDGNPVIVTLQLTFKAIKHSYIEG